jgi:hypothetical protein
MECKKIKTSDKSIQQEDSTRGLDIPKMRLLSNGGIIDNNCVCIIYMTGSIFRLPRRSKVVPYQTEPEPFKHILVWKGPVMEIAKAESFVIRETTPEEQNNLNNIKGQSNTNDEQFIGQLEPKDRNNTTGIFEYYKDDYKKEGFRTANINESYFVSSNPDPDIQKDMLEKYETSLNNEKQRLKSLNTGGKKTKRRTSKRRKTVSNKKNKRA